MQLILSEAFECLKGRLWLHDQRSSSAVWLNSQVISIDFNTGSVTNKPLKTRPTTTTTIVILHLVWNAFNGHWKYSFNRSFRFLHVKITWNYFALHLRIVLLKVY